MEVFIKLVKPPKITEDISETRRNNHKGFTSQTSLICDEEIKLELKHFVPQDGAVSPGRCGRSGVNI